MSEDAGKIDKEHPLGNIVLSDEKLMAEFNANDHVAVDYDNFIRVGLPLLHGILSNEIDDAAWLKYIGGSNQELRVIQGDRNYIIIPKLIASRPTAIYADPETPTFGSYYSELSLNRKDNPEYFDSVIAQLMQRSLPDEEMNDVFLNQINIVFEDNGFTVIPVEMIEATTASKTGVTNESALVEGTVSKEDNVGQHENKTVEGDLL